MNYSLSSPSCSFTADFKSSYLTYTYINNVKPLGEVKWGETGDVIREENVEKRIILDVGYTVSAIIDHNRMSNEWRGKSMLTPPTTVYLHDSNRNNHHHDKGIRLDYLWGIRGQGKDMKQKLKQTKSRNRGFLEVIIHCPLNMHSSISSFVAWIGLTVALVINYVFQE